MVRSAVFWRWQASFGDSRKRLARFKEEGIWEKSLICFRVKYKDSWGSRIIRGLSQKLKTKFDFFAHQCDRAIIFLEKEDEVSNIKEGLMKVDGNLSAVLWGWQASFGDS